MRTLNFQGSDSAEIFEILYQRLVNSTRGFEAPTETRVLSHILDKLEAIGTPVEQGGVATFTLNGFEMGSVKLEEAEFKLMAEALREVKWTAKAARKVTRAMDFFYEAPESDATI